jgi:hypothetical protein
MLSGEPAELLSARLLRAVLSAADALLPDWIERAVLPN